MLCFAALGAGNGATFQLVPLRWPLATAVAGGMIGEIGALGGGILPNVLGLSKQHTGSYQSGWICYAGLAFAILIMMRVVSRSWTRTWVSAGGRAITLSPTPADYSPALDPYLAAD
jgi:NNP family nitrate/nitrite transporter-like MFS transporter